MGSRGAWGETDRMARMGGWLDRVRWAMEQRGLLGTLRLAVARMRGGPDGPRMQHPFDREHGVETSGLIGGARLEAGHAHALHSTAYFGVPPSRMRRVLERWRATGGVGAVETYAFVDIGCGKGRALLVAAAMPFREALGVELDGALAEVAKRNVSRWRELGRARCPVRVERGDATEVELPGGPLLVYLYNPFRAPVLRRLLERMEARGGPVDVLYLYPEEARVFAEFPAFRLLWTEEIGLDPGDVGVDEISAAVDPCRAYRIEPTAREGQG